jgi:hypothetical protein
MSLNKSKIDWKAELKNGYVGDNAPDDLKADVKTMDRVELEERYLDAMVRFYRAYDDLCCEILDNPLNTPKPGGSSDETPSRNL